MTFENCSAPDGGGMAVGQKSLLFRGAMTGRFLQFPSGSATFRNCRAVRSGGCLYLTGKLQVSGSLDFETTTAEYGGGMFVEGIVDASRSKMSFSNCHATASGGGDQNVYGMDNSSYDITGMISCLHLWRSNH